MRSLAFAVLILSLLGGGSFAEAQQAPARPSQDGKGDAPGRPGQRPGQPQPSSELASLRATVAKQTETIDAQRRYIAGLERSNALLKQQLAAAAKP